MGKLHVDDITVVTDTQADLVVGRNDYPHEQLIRIQQGDNELWLPLASAGEFIRAIQRAEALGVTITSDLALKAE